MGFQWSLLRLSSMIDAQRVYDDETGWRRLWHPPALATRLQTDSSQASFMGSEQLNMFWHHVPGRGDHGLVCTNAVCKHM